MQSKETAFRFWDSLQGTVTIVFRDGSEMVVTKLVWSPVLNLDVLLLPWQNLV